MHAINQKAAPLPGSLLWIRILRDFLLLVLFGLGMYALIELPGHMELVAPPVIGKTIWSYFWQASFVSAVIVLVKYWQQIMRRLKSKIFAS